MSDIRVGKGSMTRFSEETKKPVNKKSAKLPITQKEASSDEDIDDLSSKMEKVSVGKKTTSTTRLYHSTRSSRPPRREISRPKETNSPVKVPASSIQKKHLKKFANKFDSDNETVNSDEDSGDETETSSAAGKTYKVGNLIERYLDSQGATGICVFGINCPLRKNKPHERTLLHAETVILSECSYEEPLENIIESPDDSTTTSNDQVIFNIPINYLTQFLYHCRLPEKEVKKFILEEELNKIVLLQMMKSLYYLKFWRNVVLLKAGIYIFKKQLGDINWEGLRILEDRVYGVFITNSNKKRYVTEDGERFWKKEVCLDKECSVENPFHYYTHVHLRSVLSVNPNLKNVLKKHVEGDDEDSTTYLVCPSESMNEFVRAIVESARLDHDRVKKQIRERKREKNEDRANYVDRELDE